MNFINCKEFKNDENLNYSWRNSSDGHRPIRISKNKVKTPEIQSINAALESKADVSIDIGMVELYRVDTAWNR
jgi:hypothetical protein